MSRPTVDRTLPHRPKPLHWLREIGVGFYRSLLLVGLTGASPALAVAVWLGGSHFALSWSAHMDQPHLHLQDGVLVLGPPAPTGLQLLAAVGEWALATLWAVLALWLALILFAGPLSQAARGLAGRWLAVRIEPSYRPLAPLTRMATGYWWNGHEYHRRKQTARRQAFLLSYRRDPQRRRDMLWVLVASVTVLPVAALPPLALATAVYARWTGLLGWAVAPVVLALVTAPFAWRVLGALGPRFLGPPPRSVAEQRVEALKAMQADLTQAQAAELERIERGLHDGAQARLVALGMSLGAAERLIPSDPDGARAILREARGSAATALAELRSLVRGINPPVLTERGLVDAVRALALDAPLEVTVRGTLPSRPERPLESAVYFAVAELLANAAKHAHAARATVELCYRAETLTAVVTDHGVGGAVASAGSGLSGIERRMATFGGRLEIESPIGGPTEVRVAVPCVLS